MSFNFGNDIFITFEMPEVAYSRPVDKIHISLQFRPSVIRGPWTIALRDLFSFCKVRIMFSLKVRSILVMGESVKKITVKKLLVYESVK
jgi:hypothetical protein